jgi:hypothetical protein
MKMTGLGDEERHLFDEHDVNRQCNITMKLFDCTRYTINLTVSVCARSMNGFSFKSANVMTKNVFSCSYVISTYGAVWKYIL